MRRVIVAGAETVLRVVAVVDPGEPFLRNARRLEPAAQPGVDRDVLVERAIGAVEVAADRVGRQVVEVFVVGGLAVRVEEAGGEHPAVPIFLAVGVAQRLGDVQSIAETMVEDVADLPAFAVVHDLLAAGVVDREILRDRHGARQHGAIGGDGREGIVPITLVAAEQGQHRVGPRLPADRRRAEKAIDAGVADEAVGIAIAEVQAGEQGARGVQRRIGIHRALDQVPGAGRRGDAQERVRLRTLADQVDEPAERRLAEQHGCRALQHLDLLNRGEFLIQANPCLVDQPVQVDAAVGGVEAADRISVVEAVGGAARHARDGAQRFGQASDAACLDRVGRHDGDRLRRLDQRDVRLSRLHGILEPIAGDDVGGGCRTRLRVRHRRDQQGRRKTRNHHPLHHAPPGHSGGEYR